MVSNKKKSKKNRMGGWWLSDVQFEFEWWFIMCAEYDMIISIMLVEEKEHVSFDRKTT